MNEQRRPGERGGHEVRRPELPRRVRQGIKLRDGERPPGAGDLARRWLRLLESTVGEAQRLDGLSYARGGQTARLGVRGGVIEAEVQGRAPRPYQTTLRVPVFAASDWETLINAVAADAAQVARLLDGELPEEFARGAASMGLELVPVRAEQLEMRCTCAEPDPCKHAATVGWLIAQQIDVDPHVLLDLRGIGRQRLLDRLRQVRAMHTHGVAAAHADPLIPESQIDPPPLEQLLEEFWREGAPIALLREQSPPSYAPTALLRRLGPSPLAGRFPLVGLLASVYDAVRDEAIHMRDRAERIEDPEE